MKLIGFIKEHNNIKEAVFLNELISYTDDSNCNLDKVLKYLNSGELLIAWMGYFIDKETNRLIAPDSYFTDGTWVWPSYLPYYLELYKSFRIDPEFLIHLESQGFELKISDKFESQKKELEKEFSKKLNIAN